MWCPATAWRINSILDDIDGFWSGAVTTCSGICAGFLSYQYPIGFDQSVSAIPGEHPIASSKGMSCTDHTVFSTRVIRSGFQEPIQDPDIQSSLVLGVQEFQSRQLVSFQS